jgi:hypothetical protein
VNHILYCSTALNPYLIVMMGNDGEIISIADLKSAVEFDKGI